ncbi:carbohydrate ABC transporter permease [Paenibacillus radicis (ex Xue et al. 2023)]|uniref:Carbohydrate ABC transporter permease n=1 Tax=Paenibacillus radicis (ex Xue et al. 2023) TaxID=2972489 RepID=A0ABT1YFN5_9BACL|nr:carbohydrate ABC transporter permease [Paenibacillus radicis (ex Xue et al. 2023)]MCR8632006.1 carbohydrate ABC transporter permease [Paenibacillus radicis (ex Xue et al. 2023)]
MMGFHIRDKDLMFTFLSRGILVISLISVIFPFLYVVLTSFAPREEIVTRGFFLIPHQWTINAYGYLMNSEQFIISFNNAVYITLVGTTVNMTLTSLMAYGLSKPWLGGRRVLNFMVLFTMLFGGGIIPTYLVVKSLHLLNSYWALFLSGAIAPFHLIVMRSFFQNIPIELEESARIDGCGELRLFWQVILPLSLPAVATFTLFYAVQNWNAYFNAVMYLNDSDKWPLQVFLRQMMNEANGSMETMATTFQYSPAVKMAAIVLTALPLLVGYPFMQKYFNKGMLMGSVKG